MLRRSPSEATGYWLQLIVAVGIATLGLVLGSTAVVIGAMLIAPLMGPILSFGMGLAIGSPFLVLRAGLRIAMSVVVAIGSSALITRLLPFHELNAEIAARTTPTVLDLLTAAFCALAGVYAAMRPASDVASAAAGTSIGISLVPPLCASGFGLGTSTWGVAGGAALLFLTNFVAIVVAGTICFAAAGFHRVDVAGLEAQELNGGGESGVVRALARRLERLFASKSGPWLRLFMPLALLVGVYVPLRSALDEMVWQIRVRKDVQAAIAELPTRIVDSRIRVERGSVDVTVVLIGNTRDADGAKARLGKVLGRAPGVTPRIEVHAVPDAAAVAGLQAELNADRAPPVIAQPSVSEQIQRARVLVETAVRGHWPRRGAGEPLSISVSVTSQRLGVEVLHIGAALDGIARETLGLALERELEQPVDVRDLAFPVDELVFDGDATFINRISPLIELSKRAEPLSVCVTRSPPSSSGKVKGDDALLKRMERLLQGHPRLSVRDGSDWAVRFVVGDCPAVPSDAGAPAAP